MGYNCLRYDHILGKIVEGLWDFGMDKPFINERPVPDSVGALKIRVLRTMQMEEVWLVTFQGDV